MLTFASLFGYLYVICWSSVYYPQIYRNYSRHSVIGYSFDMCIYNFFAQIAYATFNSSRMYSQMKFNLPPAVQWNDVVFAVHGVFANMVIGYQILTYSRGGQAVSKFCISIVSTSAFIFMCLCVLSHEYVLLPWDDIEIRDISDNRHHELLNTIRDLDGISVVGTMYNKRLSETPLQLNTISTYANHLPNFSIDRSKINSSEFVKEEPSIDINMNKINPIIENGNTTETLNKLKPNNNEELKPNNNEELKPNNNEELKPNNNEELKPNNNEEHIVESIHNKVTFPSTNNELQPINSYGSDPWSLSHESLNEIPKSKESLALIEQLERIKKRLPKALEPVLDNFLLIPFNKKGRLSLPTPIQFLGLVKVFLGAVKYIPQVLLNLKRRSTGGMPVQGFCLDICGAICSLLQNIIGSIEHGDIRVLTDNIPKLLISFTVLFYNIIFVIQYGMFLNDTHDLEMGITNGKLGNLNLHKQNENKSDWVINGKQIRESVSVGIRRVIVNIHRIYLYTMSGVQTNKKNGVASIVSHIQ